VGWHSLQFAEKDEIFFGREFVVDHGGVRNIAGTAVGRGFRRGARERQVPCCGAHDARGDAQKGGFAGTVAAREHDAFSGSNFQGDATEGEESTVTLIDVFKAKTGWRGRRQSLIRVAPMKQGENPSGSADGCY